MAKEVMSNDPNLIPIDRTGAMSPTRRTISSDPVMRKILALAKSVARTPSTVMLSGESGVGKEVVAKYIHDRSPRAARPFVAINCAALPASLLESELFGHERGAFSGAIARHQGVFERANSGTILLDEISEVSLETQATLLRVLQERRMTRVGGQGEIPLDIRIIATTNRQLRECVDAGTFRLDLYYRLNVFPLKIPALRERRGDIPPLALYYLGQFAEQFDSPVRAIRRDALAHLCAHHFPGNVRELVNVLERAVILAVDSEVLLKEHLLLDTDIHPDRVSSGFGADHSSTAYEIPPSFDIRRPSATASVPARPDPDTGQSPEPGGGVEQDEHLIRFEPGSEPLTDVRRKIILGTLQRFEGNRTKTAEALGVSLRTIRNKIRDYRDLGEDVPDSDK